MDEDNNGNYEVFRDCMSAAIIDKSSRNTPRQPKKRLSKGRKGSTATLITSNAKGDGAASIVTGNDDPADLADFIEYLAKETFTSFPPKLQSLSHQSIQNDPPLSEVYSQPLSMSTIEDLTATIPPTVIDTLTTYSILSPPQSDLQSFFSPVLAAYISSVTAPPPPWISTRTSACEICERDWIPLTYHHLIPRGVHVKVLKRGWHEEHILNSVAWLCRACHSFVHRMAGNEELAREWFTVERILEREDVQKWAGWVGGIRWKKR